MFVGDHKLVYFAFPKCGSEFIRYSLNLNWVLDCDPLDWESGAIEYCHIRPQRFVEAYNLDWNVYKLFTIVRNPFERLVSCWHFFNLNIGPLLTDRFDTFDNFIREIYNYKHDMSSLPCHWFYMPLERYFDGVLNNVTFFKLENINQCIDWLRKNYSIDIENKKVNTSTHDHYSTYYSPYMVELVKDMYKYEIEKFDYTFDAIQLDNVATPDPN